MNSSSWIPMKKKLSEADEEWDCGCPEAYFYFVARSSPALYLVVLPMCRQNKCKVVIGRLLNWMKTIVLVTCLVNVKVWFGYVCCLSLCICPDPFFSLCLSQWNDSLSSLVG